MSMQSLRLTPTMTMLQMMKLTIVAYRVGQAANDSLKDPKIDPKLVDADIDWEIAKIDIMYDLTVTQRDYLLGIARSAARPSSVKAA